MSDNILRPEDCRTMVEVRQGVDSVDRELIDLLQRRYGYMRAAARIKDTRDAVRDEGRKAEVIENVTQMAGAAGLPTNDLAAIWNDLVESSIAYELTEWDRLRS